MCLAVASSRLSVEENLEFGVLDIFMLHTAHCGTAAPVGATKKNWELMADGHGDVIFRK